MGAIERKAMPAAATLVETLPGWTYDNAEFYALERERLLSASWQVLCHVNDVPRPGDYAAMDLFGERVFVVRGRGGGLKSFHNICRHRAHAVVTGARGNCRGVIRCPYHGWTYELDGRLKAVPGEPSFPGLPKAAFGLRPVEHEVFLGFVFVRLEAGGPGVAERLAPYRDELAYYRLEEMRPVGSEWSADVGVDWKNVMDNFLEGYHVPAGHPGLFRLFGARYEIETRAGDVSRAVHWLRDRPSDNWSERHYQKLLPEVAHLPAERRRAWAYYTLLPNVALDIYPDHMEFFHIVPTGPGRAHYRGRTYALPGASREMRAARYLGVRINMQVQREDDSLVRSVQAGLASEHYGAGVFSEKEACVAQLHEMVRRVLPVARRRSPPPAGTMRAVNDGLAEA
jgi:phenylpropionate dioxygenase-like ring-hydroxylating dioxygenase large terminal subunit